MTQSATLSPLSAVPQPVIRLDAVSKSFRLPAGRFDAVCDVSLSIRAGDTFGIIGKSGAGKSTLLRLINLLERPDHGAVYVAGTELTGLGKSALRAARQNIGMIFQQFNLLQNETVFENVAFRCACTAAATANRSPRGCASVWRSWGWRTSPPAIRRSCPAARSSAWPSLARWPANRRCCCATSPPPRWIPKPPARCWACCATSTGGWA